MSRRTGPYPRVPALCNECGTQRDAAFRTIADTVQLKCVTCRQQTPHAIVAPEGWDWREKLNRESKDARHLQQLIEFIQSRGVLIWWNPTPQGGRADVRRFLEPLELDGRESTEFISVNPNLTAAEKVSALRWGWKALLPGDGWDRAPVLEYKDAYFTGVYDNRPERSSR